MHNKYQLFSNRVLTLTLILLLSKSASIVLKVSPYKICAFSIICFAISTAWTPCKILLAAQEKALGSYPLYLDWFLLYQDV
jgi:hypothetical protein